MNNEYPNETIRLLVERASCRSFDLRPVEPEILQHILEAGIHAPNGGNLQPYSVIKIENDDTKRRLVDLCGGQKYVAQAPVVLVFCIDWHRTARWADLERAPFTATSSFRAFWISLQDTVLCAQNMVTAADSLGLGSVYIGSVIESFRELREILELPDKVLPVVMLLLGYPRGKPPRQKRLATRLVVHDEKYREPSDEELLDALRKKYPWQRQATDEALEKLAAVCRTVHGPQFADECVARIRRDGFISPAQWYFGLWYRADVLAEGNEAFVDLMEEFGFDWFKEYHPFEERERGSR
jgi:nitroreductase